jgi:enamine deaminase RidA (YjgF/YER057c/UK114 family)
MVKTSELMEGLMQAPNGKKSLAGTPSSRIKALGIDLPSPPVPLGVYVEVSDTGNLLFLSGILPMFNRKLAISGRLGRELSIVEGQEAARLSSLNVLAAAKQHLGTLDRLKKLIKLTVIIATTEEFAEHASVADGASNVFVQIFGQEFGHTRLVFGAHSLPANTPVIVDAIFEIERKNSSTAN